MPTDIVWEHPGWAGMPPTHPRPSASFKLGTLTTLDKSDAIVDVADPVVAMDGIVIGHGSQSEWHGRRQVQAMVRRCCPSLSHCERLLLGKKCDNRR